ncbi:MAG: hypothetical protein ACT4OE_05695 [Sphingosinicella sp.]
MKTRFSATALIASAALLAACGGETATTTNAASSNDASAAGAEGAAAEEGAAAPAADISNQNFQLANNTGATIREVYVSTVNTDQWEEDVLGTSVLPTGQTATINFAREEEECMWDIRVVLESGQSAELRGVNLCETATITAGASE